MYGASNKCIFLHRYWKFGPIMHVICLFKAVLKTADVKCTIKATQGAMPLFVSDTSLEESYGAYFTPFQKVVRFFCICYSIYQTIPNTRIQRQECQVA